MKNTQRKKKLRKKNKQIIIREKNTQKENETYLEKKNTQKEKGKKHNNCTKNFFLRFAPKKKILCFAPHARVRKKNLEKKRKKITKK